MENQTVNKGLILKLNEDKLKKVQAKYRALRPTQIRRYMD
jgi:hypothetical protein